MKISIKVDPTSGQKYVAVSEKGKALLVDPLTNKGSAFTDCEREELDLKGMLPPVPSNMKEQLDRAYENFKARPTVLEQYIFLSGLQDRNETLFYRLCLEHIDEMMPIVYTPGVGAACQNFHRIYRRSRGLFININQKNEIEQILRNCGIKDPSVIVVTDGERILGLGDLGVSGMGIPIGKLVLYTLCAGVMPHATLPITLDAGTDNEKFLNDPLYFGLRQKRVRGAEYQEFIDAFVAAVQKVFPKTLLQWEDFLKGNAIHQLKKFRDQLCSFNDDIQGTAGVIVAGLFAAMRITKKTIKEQRVVFAGAGAAAQGISDLIVSAMVADGLTLEQANKNIWTVDRSGLVTKARTKLEDFKATYAREVSEVANYKCKDKNNISLLETVENAKPTILIGTSATPGMFSKEVVEAMAKCNERPIIFPISNPTSKVECTPADAIQWSDGRAIMATGSPFDPVTYKGKTHRIGQGNNAFLFPGVGLGICAARISRVTDSMFLAAARALAEKVTDADIAETAVFPQLSTIRECSHAVACATVRQAVKEGYASEEILEGLEENIRQAMWDPKYLPIHFEE